jgi:muconolactone delta-isomerase
MAEAAKNRLNEASRPPWWLVFYDLDPVFFNLSADEQYKLETDDAVDAVELAIESKWKAAYTTTDFKKGWILLQVDSREEAEEVIHHYKMFPYFTNITYTPVYSATKAGINAQIVWDGFKKYVHDHI